MFGISNLEGKITECWLVNEGAFFLNFAREEGKITLSWLVLRLPSNSLYYREVVTRKLSVAMAFRFEKVDEECIEELKDERKLKHEEKSRLFSNHSAVKREQIIFTLETMKRRQESGVTGKIHE